MRFLTGPTRTNRRTPAAALLVCIFLLCPLSGRGQTAPPAQAAPASPADAAAPGDAAAPKVASAPSQKPTAPDGKADLSPGQKPMSPEDARQAQLIADTNKLYQLAQELQAEVAKSSKNTLSLSVVKKAAEVEKLAKSLKERMKTE